MSFNAFSLAQYRCKNWIISCCNLIRLYNLITYTWWFKSIHSTVSICSNHFQPMWIYPAAAPMRYWGSRQRMETRRAAVDALVQQVRGDYTKIAQKLHQHPRLGREMESRVKRVGWQKKHRSVCDQEISRAYFLNQYSNTHIYTHAYISIHFHI